ncbi:DUF4241 domain-containing protein [Chryseobacterium polytrichastri]|uniref:DUF4241 domain-containing protein n=1 Tax=Chryseobacterium polytrichastri TaxID=1302687 RepID=A0A1M7GZ88_9FLAO|nr:DUF4241 domain-containing protein [Chryseobacterium polytrichastri]SHM21714.1 Protein of unknown function [Chryseobacterium polytrichastri]
MDENWLKKYEEIKDLLVSPKDLELYFTSTQIGSVEMEVMDVGNVSLPSGKIIIRDPNVLLEENERPFLIQAPKGNFPVKLAVIKTENSGSRYAAAKIQFTDNQPMIYREALKGDEDIENYEKGNFFGFGVDTGLAFITDAEVFAHFFTFRGGDIPDDKFFDYTTELFENSYQKNPQNQREIGDWINMNIPETPYHIPVFATGFGDGGYPVYFGYDSQDQITGLYIYFIDVESLF